MEWCDGGAAVRLDIRRVLTTTTDRMADALLMYVCVCVCSVSAIVEERGWLPECGPPATRDVPMNSLSHCLSNWEFVCVRFSVSECMPAGPYTP